MNEQEKAIIHDIIIDLRKAVNSITPRYDVAVQIDRLYKLITPERGE